MRLRLDLILRLCQEHQPDIICLQETKVADEYFPHAAVKQLGFQYMAFAGEKSYNGVAILSKREITSSFSIDIYNKDKRHIAAKIEDFEVHNFYVPAGGDEPDVNINPKYKHKLIYLEEMKKWFLANRHPDENIILLGDLNVAPFEHDVWSSHQLRNVISHTDQEREKLIRLKDSFNFIDTGRKFVDKKEKLYSWWSYRNIDWKKANRGRRLDHIWVSRALEPRLEKIMYHVEARSWDKPSDHVPFMLDFYLR